jgi:hypothetical protein
VYAVYVHNSFEDAILNNTFVGGPVHVRNDRGTVDGGYFGTFCEPVNVTISGNVMRQSRGSGFDEKAFVSVVFTANLPYVPSVGRTLGVFADNTFLYENATTAVVSGLANVTYERQTIRPVA